MEMIKVASNSLIVNVINNYSSEIPINIKRFIPTPSSTSTQSLHNGVSTDKTDNRDTRGLDYEDVDMRRDDAGDMRKEENRLKTFENWPVSFLSPKKLAQNGFYYLGREDEVRCAFCKVEIMRWEEGDDPEADHRRWAPQCSFLRQTQRTSSVPLNAPDAAGRDECGVKAPAATPVVQMPGPVHPQYSTEAARIKSFKDWPRSLRQKPKDLAEAGFFYTGQGDKTKCFYCDGGLKDWENDDVPWEQHARWFDRCAFVLLVKGREYVQKVMTEACFVAAAKEASTSTASDTTNAINTDTESEKDESSTDDKMCKICYAEERNVCFVPCGHVVACAKCALATNKCPMCRRTFQTAVRLYFS